MQNFGGSHPPVPPGSISLGGPIVTAGGLVFIAGTIDPFLHAFNMVTGEELWTGQLPAGGHAKLTEEPQSDALVAFTLP
jgi:quinoprotein glucose dehydrogenase